MLSYAEEFNIKQHTIKLPVFQRVNGADTCETKGVMIQQGFNVQVFEVCLAKGM